MNTILECETGRDVPLRDDQAIPNRRATVKEADLREKPHLKLQRILVPVDFTPASVHALRYATTLAERFGSTVSLLHVVEVAPFAMNGTALILMEADKDVTRDTIEVLGSTADRVVHQAACPVLVLQCADKPQLEPTLWRDTEEDTGATPAAPATSKMP